MYGAILGDIVGSPYEFDRGNKSKEFEMFNDSVEFTDDTIMTIAVAEGIMNAKADIKSSIIESMKRWGKAFPYAGYGIRFANWLKSESNEPYGSYGNGSAMRVSSVGWLYPSLKETREIARISAEVTHNHSEGIKGAESVAAAIYLARNECDKREIKNYIIKHFGYDLSRTCDEIRPTYHHVESCQETVPEAIIAFLEGNDFEDCIRNAVSLGGDCDTLTCITGGIAEAFYGISEEFKMEVKKRITKEMQDVLDKFEEIRR